MSDTKAIAINESMGTLCSEVLNVWEHGYMGVDIGSIIVAILIFGLFLLIRGLFSKYILTVYENFYTLYIIPRNYIGIIGINNCEV